MRKRLVTFMTALVLAALVALPAAAAAGIITPLEPTFSANSVRVAE